MTTKANNTELPILSEDDYGKATELQFKSEYGIDDILSFFPEIDIERIRILISVKDAVLNRLTSNSFGGLTFLKVLHFIEKHFTPEEINPHVFQERKHLLTDNLSFDSFSTEPRDDWSSRIMDVFGLGYTFTMAVPYITVQTFQDLVYL